MYQFLQDEQGAAAIEYSLFVSLIGMVIIGVLQVLGGNLIDAFSSVSSGFTPGQVTENSPNGRF